jgi:type I restriction enzyme S subunit
LWRDFYDLADQNFVERLPFEFHQRWFEMYLGATLRGASLDVSAPKPGPDAQVMVDGRPTYIEAIAPTAGHPVHPDTVQKPVYTDADGNPVAAKVPHTQITLRLADAFRKKADVFDGYRRKGYVGKEDPCIIAINLRDIPHAWADAEEFWFRALYGVGDRFVVIDRAGGATMAGRDHRALLNRAGGAAEDVVPLLNADRAGISGVLGSAADVGNIPNPLGDEFLLMPHAIPLAPYRPGFIRRGAEVQLRADTGDRWALDTIDYGAHQPRGPEKLVAEFEGSRHEGEWAISGRILSVRIAGHRCDVPIRGGDEPASVAEQIACEMIRAYGAEDRTAESEGT